MLVYMPTVANRAEKNKQGKDGKERQREAREKERMTKCNVNMRFLDGKQVSVHLQVAHSISQLSGLCPNQCL